jgi:hypothetical protein
VAGPAIGYGSVVDEPVEREPSEDVPGEGDSVEDVVRRGRWSGTPFVALGSVAVVLWLAVAVVAGAALLVWWLL